MNSVTTAAQFVDGTARRGWAARQTVRLPWLMLATLLGGCASQPAAPPPQRLPVNLSGYSAAFKEGFAAGCDTAHGNARRDDARYRDDTQYARGWEDGRAICARR